MLYKLAFLVVLQAFLASGTDNECGIDVCAYKTCAQLEASEEEKEKCCADAVKGLCTLSHLLYGFDPVQVPEEIGHYIATASDSPINVYLQDVFVKGIRGPDSYSNHTCYLNGFDLRIHYKKLEIFGSTKEGPFHAVAKNVKTGANLSVTYFGDNQMMLNIGLLDDLPKIGDYTVSVGSHQTELSGDDVNPEEVRLFIANLLREIFNSVYSRLLIKHPCM